jgi:hypothetical protein
MKGVEEFIQGNDWRMPYSNGRTKLHNEWKKQVMMLRKENILS